MINKLRKIVSDMYIKRLVQRGLKLGENVDFEKGVNIDANFPWLIEIEDNVVLSPWVYILSHDSSSKSLTGLMKIGKVSIGKNTFIGARSIIMPGTKIGKNCVIGANSIVTRDIPDNSVAVGNPARVISTIDEYKDKLHTECDNYGLIYSRSFTLWGGVDDKKKEKMQEEIIEVAFVDADHF